MDDNSDVYIPRTFRSTQEDCVRKIWQKIPPQGGIYAEVLRLQIGKGEQEILDNVLREWADRNVVKLRNPSNPFITKRPKAWWEQVVCPRCRKTFHAHSQFEEHWKEESRLLSPEERQKYIQQMREKID